MQDYSKSLITVLIAIFLTGCTRVGALLRQQSLISREEVWQVTLANGKQPYIGEQLPDLMWQCKQIGFKQLNRLDFARGTPVLSTAISQREMLILNSHNLERQIVAYANQQNFAPNYIFVQIPAPSTASSIKIYYYSCNDIRFYTPYRGTPPLKSHCHYFCGSD